MTDARLLDAVAAVLDEARARGYLGLGDPRVHLEHAMGFAAAATEGLGGREPRRYADLGTGGGVPGLVLAACWPRAPGTLVESSRRRAADLRRWVRQLGLAGRVTVSEARAEDLAHDPAHRGRYDLVTARSFGPPAAVAEIASGLVSVGGVLVVSEPPGGAADRWPAPPLAELGFGPPELRTEGAATFAVLPRRERGDAALPRRRGRPWKRPRW